MTGPDPLRELIQHFGLQTIPMDAEQVALDGVLLNDVPGMRRKYGEKTAAAIEAFRKRCTEMMSPLQYYEGVGAHDNEHPWAFKTCEQLLDEEIDDPVAKRFFKVMARSDIATESHNTNGLNALKNFVMDVDGYIGLYSIQNGNEQLIECLRSEVNADIQLNHRVLKVGKTDAGRYRLNMMNGKGPETRDFDLVLMCLPHSWLSTMAWEGERLRASMVKHIAYFDRPAHYLRVSVLFDEPFWGEKIPGSWFMSEAFGGCCVYNEGSRHDVGKHGVLMASKDRCHSVVLDLYEQWKGLEANGQFRFTPPTHALVAFHQAMKEHAAEGGVAARGNRYARNAQILIKGMRDMGFTTLLSDNQAGPIIQTFLTPRDPNFDFEQFYEALRARGFAIYPGKLTKRPSFRIGTIGKVNDKVMAGVLDAIRDVLAEMNVTDLAPLEG
jgi:hypothetical protein